MKNKATDSKIKKALECCATRDGCKICPRSYNGEMCRGDTPTEMILDALDLINRLEAEIERLQASIKEADEYFSDGDFAKGIALIINLAKETMEDSDCNLEATPKERAECKCPDGCPGTLTTYEQIEMGIKK